MIIYMSDMKCPACKLYSTYAVHVQICCLISMQVKVLLNSAGVAYALQ